MGSTVLQLSSSLLLQCSQGLDGKAESQYRTMPAWLVLGDLPEWEQDANRNASRPIEAEGLGQYQK